MNIGVLNSGGDSPGLNAVIEGVVGAASRRGWNVVGFYDGFEGLLSEEGDERFEWLTPAACRGLRAKGGTILGTVNKGNFAIKVGVDQKGAIEPAVLEKTKATVRRLGLDALIVVGGDGSQASHVIHVDRWWNPAVENQATDRAYRIGQHRNVLVHRLICRGTIEDRIDAMLKDKRRMADDLFSGGPEQWLMNMGAEELNNLFSGSPC